MLCNEPKSAIQLPVIIMTRTKIPKFTLIKNSDIPIIAKITQFVSIRGRV